MVLFPTPGGRKPIFKGGPPVGPKPIMPPGTGIGWAYRYSGIGPGGRPVYTWSYHSYPPPHMLRRWSRRYKQNARYNPYTKQVRTTHSGGYSSGGYFSVSVSSTVKTKTPEDIIKEWRSKLESTYTELVEFLKNILSNENFPEELIDKFIAIQIPAIEQIESCASKLISVDDVLKYQYVKWFKEFFSSILRSELPPWIIVSPYITEKEREFYSELLLQTFKYLKKEYRGFSFIGIDIAELQEVRNFMEGVLERIEKTAKNIEHITDNEIEALIYWISTVTLPELPLKNSTTLDDLHKYHYTRWLINFMKSIIEETYPPAPPDPNINPYADEVDIHSYVSILIEMFSKEVKK